MLLSVLFHAISLVAGTTIGGNLLKGWLQRIEISRLGRERCGCIRAEFFDVLDEVILVFPNLW
ncbi:hypothetical protein D3C80_2185760 [compost metagenome]